MSAAFSAYELLRLDNLRQNAQILAELGLRPVDVKLTADKSVSATGCRDKENSLALNEKEDQISASRASLKRKRSVNRNCDLESSTFNQSIGDLRRSTRLIGKPAKYTFDDLYFVESFVGQRSRSSKLMRVPTRKLDESTYTFKRTDKMEVKFYGPAPNVPIGTHFQSRLECCYAGIHAPSVAGIHPGPDGAYSVCLSGGYEDDVDLGEAFTYTGEGGRDLRGTATAPKNLRTAPQSRDQTLSRGNLALQRSLENKMPVRVVRGYKLNSVFAPSSGYRYDGLYTVEKSWLADGLSGFKVFRFAFKRLPDQPQLERHEESATNDDE